MKKIFTKILHGAAWPSPTEAGLKLTEYSLLRGCQPKQYSHGLFSLKFSTIYQWNSVSYLLIAQALPLNVLGLFVKITRDDKIDDKTI